MTNTEIQKNFSNKEVKAADEKLLQDYLNRDEIEGQLMAEEAPIVDESRLAGRVVYAVDPIQ